MAFVTVKHTVSIIVDNREWVVPEDAIQEVGGEKFIKLAASKYGFAKLVCV